MLNSMQLTACRVCVGVKSLQIKIVVVVVVVEWFTAREFWLLLLFFMFHTWKKKYKLRESSFNMTRGEGMKILRGGGAPKIFTHLKGRL